MAMLICEGACNPALPVFDAAAEDYAEKLGRPYYGKESDVVLDAQFRCARLRQTLTHTEHAPLGGNRYGCTVCGCERQYGPAWAALDADGWRVA